MIERVIEFSVRNRVFVIAAGLVLAVWGLYAVYHTPVDAIPDVSENQVIVFTEWPGHSPREIEDQVTYPLSLSLQGLAGVRVIRSSSDFNFSMINVILEDSVEFYFARQQVAERLARAGPRLPPGVVPSLAPDALATGQIFWYTVEGAGVDPGRLRAVQDWYVRPQLQSVPGVAEVASVGGQAIEYQIVIDPELLRLHGVNLGAVATAVAGANAAVGGQVVHKGEAEYIVRGVGWLGASATPGGEDTDPRRVLHDLESVLVAGADGTPHRLGELARVTLGTQFRRGSFEKDGNEVTGGVVLMRYGENALEVTRRLKEKVRELQTGLPPGVRVVPVYDRTPLIRGAVRTVTATLLEAIVTATVCVLLVLLHLRTSFIIAVTLPLAVLGSFAVMWGLRQLGLADIQTNVMSLAGIAISIGVLVDSSIVMAENAMFHLKARFGDRPVRGDLREVVLPACRTVGRPIFFSVLIMLLSFVPVFALGGIEGKMFRPLAFTKTFALVTVAVLAVTLVPALCTVFIRGRLRGEHESWLVRSVVQVYRPVLQYLLDRPAALVWFMGVTFVVGFAPLGVRWLFLATLFAAVVAIALVARTWRTRAALVLSLVLAGLVADQNMKPLESEFMTPLDEGMVMDMPITVPRASITQSTNDLKARDMMFCRFPEVDMVVGKAGRAESPADPAPLDMIETMINFRPPDLWPKRKLRRADAERQAREALDELVRRGLVAAPPGEDARASLLADATAEGLARYDALLREYAYQRNQEFQAELAGKLVRAGAELTCEMLSDNGSAARRLSPADAAHLSRAVPPEVGRALAVEPLVEDVERLARHVAARAAELGLVRADADVLRYQPGPLRRAADELDALLGGGPPPGFATRLHELVAEEHRRLWRGHVRDLDAELRDRGPAAYTRVVLELLLARLPVLDASVAAKVEELRRARAGGLRPPGAAGGHHGTAAAALPEIDPCPALDDAQAELTRRFAARVLLWRKDRADLIGFGGELDRVMQMPGWTNVWTMPIQNRVDMLATGVNTAVGIRVLGRKLDDVVKASEEIAAVVRRVPGAADVVADPVRGKGYLEIRLDRVKAAALGVSPADVNELVETALGGKAVTTTVEGRERHPVRIRLPRDACRDEESLARLRVPARLAPAEGGPGGRPGPAYAELGDVADVRVVEGPASIKSENGLLRNYVRLNVRNRGAVEFVDEARRAVAARVSLPPGTFIEWTGQFEHEVRARQRLKLIFVPVLLVILLILYLTYRDLADAALMLLAVPGAVAGGVFFQWLLDYKFSVTVWVGYIACFGMATATGIIMLVYLREAVAKAGGLENLTLDQLRQAVLAGAVHRLRPKLLTEATTVIGLAPMLWATGTGAEVIRPMAAPVLGGILIADEVIDLFLPVLFYWVRRWRWQRLHGRGTPARPELPAAEAKAAGPEETAAQAVGAGPA